MYDACATIIHALISCRLDYCSSNMYNVPRNKSERLKNLRINAQRTYYPGFELE